MAAPVWINGRLVSADEAHVSFFDMGFQLGDGVYEMISTRDGVMFRLDDHLDRLDASMHATRILPKMSRDEWRGAVLDATRASGLADAGTRIIVTRGVPPPGTTDIRAATPNVLMGVTPYAYLANDDLRKRGIKLQIAQQRGMPADTLDPRYKHISRLQYQLARIEAAEAGYDDLVWLAHDGTVQETPRSNIFMVKKGTLYTPGAGVLRGITRLTLCEVASALGIPVQVGAITAFDLFVADEIFTCSTSGAALAVREVSGRPVMGSVPGPVMTRLNEAYWTLRASGKYGTRVFAKQA